MPEYFFCPSCIKKIAPRTSGFCPRCGELTLWPSLPVTLCSSCLTNPPNWDQLFFYAEHQGLLRQLLLEFKFKGGIYASRALASLLLSTMPKVWDKTDLVIPIPLHTTRLLNRGYNQSQELAKALLFLSALNAQRNGKQLSAILSPRLLLRITSTRPQTGLSRKERKQNTKDIFAASQKIQNKHILLIDDIMTTGSTLASAVKTLRLHNPASICIAVVGRTSPHTAIQKYP